MGDYELRGTLKRCINTTYSRRDIHQLITTCHKLALTYVIMKSKSHKSYFLKGECKSDLAWDYIAEIFQKDESGNLKTLQGYFSSIDVNVLDEKDLFIELRKLVFTKVDDGIFRYYGEKDPSLKKIIRNIKLSIGNLEHSVKAPICYSDGFLVLDKVNDLNQASMPEDFMRIKLCSRLEEQMLIPDILSEVIDILHFQDDYRKRFSIVILAKIIRESFVLIHDDADNGEQKPEAHRRLLKQDIDTFLEKSVNKIKKEVAPRYIKRGKMEPDHVDIYFITAAEIIRDDLTRGTGLSQYERIKLHLAHLDYDQFRNKHRSILEYMVKLIRTDLVQKLKKDWV